MAHAIDCPACGETERLLGERDADIIRLTCEACGHRWERDPKPRCPGCGSDDLIEAPKAVVEKVRGNQVSIVGYTQVRLCRDCDSELIDTLARSRAPLPPDVMPVGTEQEQRRDT